MSFDAGRPHQYTHRHARQHSHQHIPPPPPHPPRTHFGNTAFDDAAFDDPAVHNTAVHNTVSSNTAFDNTAELRRLRSAYRLLRRSMTLAALGYFVLFLLLSAFAPGLMDTSLFAGLNIGLLMGLLQLPVAFAAAIAYERLARRNVDPLARRVQHAQGGGQ
ncbi:DUF485 domain-containing protein [Streptomyces gobiensis]|uniref:DUF485 domain-containing protein n=1 Tax=Streptomyces gobiensis TaxID=2875706 RepID=UPI001E4637A7|nr:DUF485 domain-containing protein [Streptomyces gobiensis]UGY91840.1 DUF485 domain-containing protein [Streptomyces gobiensis]